MTENQAAQWIVEKFGMTEQQLSKPRIVSFVPAALQLLANRIAEPENTTRQGVRQLLRKNFTVSVSAGVGDLTTAISAAEPLLLQFARGYLVYGTDSNYPYSYVADKASILQDFPKGIGRFTVNNSDLLVITAAGVRTPTASYTVQGPFVCTLANLKPTLDDDFLNTLYEVVKYGIPQAPPEPEG